MFVHYSSVYKSLVKSYDSCFVLFVFLWGLVFLFCFIKYMLKCTGWSWCTSFMGISTPVITQLQKLMKVYHMNLNNFVSTVCSLP